MPAHPPGSIEVAADFQDFQVQKKGKGKVIHRDLIATGLVQ